MEDINIPTMDEIENMSRELCEHERLRLRNEISFARGGAMWGGPSAEALVELLQLALGHIDQRLKQTSMHSEMHYTV